MKFGSDCTGRKIQSVVFVPAQLEEVNSLDDFYLIEVNESGLFLW